MNELEPRDTEKKGMGVGDWIWVVICALYAISPIDLVPDAIPAAGWIDDILIVLPGVLNAIQQSVNKTNEHLAKIIKILKWLVLVGGAIVIAILVLVAVLITKGCSA